MRSTLRVAVSALVSISAIAATAALHGACTGEVLGVPDASVTESGADAHAGDAPASDVPAFDGGGDGSMPFLVELAVTPETPSDASAGITLSPAFSPDIHDYSVRCAAGANSVVVSMTASTGAQSELIKPTKSAAAPRQTLSVTIAPDQAIVAAAVEGPASTEYWIRCLPPDFPVWQWEPHPEAGAPTPGYILVGNVFPIDGRAGYAIVLDPNGVPVWYQRAPGDGVFDVDSLARDEISFIASPPKGGMTVRGLGVPTTLDVSPDLDNHELRLLPNGHYLVLTVPIETGFDLTGLSYSRGGEVVHLGKNESVASSVILEIDPADGKIVWRWDVADHFDAKQSSTYPQPGASFWHGPDGGPAYDVYHCNSIDVEPATGNLLVSARNMDAVFYVDRATGAVVWKMGGTPASRDGARYVPVPDPFLRQHDARLLPGWSETACGGRGPISVFDDQTAAPAPARAVVYDVTVGEGDAGAGSCGAPGAKVAWQYAGAKNSLYMGSLRVEPDGERFIGWGVNGVSGLIASEVDVEGHDRFDLLFTPGESYRAIKVPLTQLDLPTLRRTAGAR